MTMRKADETKEYEAAFVSSATFDGGCFLEIAPDGRPLWEIAREFEGNEEIRFMDQRWTGYGDVCGVNRSRDGAVQLKLLPVPAPSEEEEHGSAV